ncbi:cytochrome P450 2J6-like, partial [Saccoglossus kowalevskii]|uniref:Cytochrome P450 2J6-like n=1 Tax=Saccoglossus kowalevskii TaxID=10224 RepID=A0ABM0MME9_SACKO
MLVELFGSLEVHTVLIFLFIFLTWLYIQRRQNDASARYPPGPWGLPVLGHLIQMGERPHLKFMHWAKQYGDVFSIRMGSHLVVVLNGHDVVKEALMKKATQFSGRPDWLNRRSLGDRGIVNTAGRVWKEQRKFAVRTLHGFGMGKEALEEVMLKEVEYVVEAFNETEGESFDPSQALQKAISNVISTVVFGERFDFDDKFFCKLLKDMDEMFENTLGALAIDLFPRLVYIADYLDPATPKFRAVVKALEGKINDRKQSRKSVTLDDEEQPTNLIDAYLRNVDKHAGEESSTFKDDYHLSEIVMELFFGGTDTTLTSLQWAFMFMLENPDVQKKVQEEIDNVVGKERQPRWEDKPHMPFTDATILEFQRINPVLPLAVPHATTNDIEFRGYHIPKGTMVFVNLFSVSRDERCWENPDKFDPNHFLNEEGEVVKGDTSLPFSAGSRECVGAQLAKPELFIFFTRLLQKFTFVYADE